MGALVFCLPEFFAMTAQSTARPAPFSRSDYKTLGLAALGADLAQELRDRDARLLRRVGRERKGGERERKQQGDAD
mgnify:CR=1 FL=1